jgi:predicted small lipoprotein YifL
MSIRTLITSIIIASVVSGCGRVGPLEAPPAREVSAVAAQPVPSAAGSQSEPLPPGSAPLAGAQSSRVGNFPDQQSAGAQEPAEAGAVAAPKRPFVLDRLL